MFVELVFYLRRYRYCVFEGVGSGVLCIQYFCGD